MTQRSVEATMRACGGKWKKIGFGWGRDCPLMELGAAFPKYVVS
jgi:hypothetical protein